MHGMAWWLHPHTHVRMRHTCSLTCTIWRVQFMFASWSCRALKHFSSRTHISHRMCPLCSCVRCQCSGFVLFPAQKCAASSVSPDLWLLPVHRGWKKAPDASVCRLLAAETLPRHTLLHLASPHTMLRLADTLAKPPGTAQPVDFHLALLGALACTATLISTWWLCVFCYC